MEEILKKARETLQKFGIDFLDISESVRIVRDKEGNEKEAHVFLTHPREMELTKEQQEKITLAPIAKRRRNRYMPKHVEFYTLILKDEPDIRYHWEAFLSWQYNDPDAKPQGVYEIWTRNKLRKKDIIMLKNDPYYITCIPIKQLGESLTEECRIGAYLREEY